MDARYGSSLSSIKLKGQVWFEIVQTVKVYIYIFSCMCLVLYVCFMLCCKLRTVNVVASTSQYDKPVAQFGILFRILQVHSVISFME